MAETQIEWTDSTWNPVAGCSIVTAGCTHCYAKTSVARPGELRHLQTLRHCLKADFTNGEG